MRRGIIKDLYEIFLTIVFPKKCLLCGDIFDVILCERCRVKLESNILFSYHDFSSEPVTTALDGLFVLYENTMEVRSLIHALKYEYITEVAPFFIKNLDLSLLPSSFDCIISMPLHRRRFCERGFNQSDSFAKLISDKIGIPVMRDFLYRSRATKQQALLDREERFLNMKDSFSIGINKKIPKSVLLCDDVYTTGATMESAAKVLKESGVKYIVGCVLTRG